MKIGSFVQPKGRPDQAGEVVSVDSGGRCGHVGIRFFARTAGGHTHRRCTLNNVEPISGKCGHETADPAAHHAAGPGRGERPGTTLGEGDGTCDARQRARAPTPI